MTRPALDVPGLAAVMRSHGLDVAGGLSLSRAGFGHSNLTYVAADEKGQRWIVRRPPLGELLSSAHDVEREYRILAALGGTDVPVPVVHCSVARGVAADVPVIVMEFVDGQVVDGFEALGRLSSSVRTVLVTELSAVLTAIHAVDIAAVGLDRLASHHAYAPRQLKRWSSQWENSRTRDLPALDAVTALLRRHAPPQERLSLIHGDFSLRNLIVDPGSGVVRAVLDWELSTLGDPLSDVGMALAYWTLADASDAGRGGQATSSPAKEERAEFVRAYLKASRIGETHVAYWHALGLWKLAIITEGVVRRDLDRPGNAGAMGMPIPSDVDRLIELAAGVARAASLE
jgi:aminoglycoside phosphotransferase (APT) family kinase protein